MLIGILAMPAAQAEVLSYAAKFVCGALGTDGDVVKGVYVTAINIQNPNSDAVNFTRRAVIALPGSTSGKISSSKSKSLKANGAMGVDCADIRKLFNPDATGHIEGFLMIEVDLAAQPNIVPLNVIGKYTARQAASQVQTMDIEVYQPTKIPTP